MPSNTVKNKYQILFDLQQKVRSIGVSRTADLGKYSYKYVALIDLLQILHTEFLKDHNLCLFQPIIQENDNNILHTYIISNTGEIIIESKINLGDVSKNPQDTGKAITYLRRYAIFSMLGLVGDKDTDGNYTSSEILASLKRVKTVQELGALYHKIREEQKEEFKDNFSERKKELLSQDEDILANVQVS